MRKQYQGVTAYVGLPGSGKTYSMAEAGLRALRRGRDVWANADHTGERAWFYGAKMFRTFDEFAAIPAGDPARGIPGPIILWDELPLFVNARKWQDFPDGLLYRFTQIRKDAIELHFSTIDWRMVDVNVRRVTFWVWECESVGFGIHKRKLWPPEERRKKDDRPRRREMFRIRDSVISEFDSFGKVSAPLALPAPVVETAGAGGVPAERGAGLVVRHGAKRLVRPTIPQRRTTTT